MNEFVPKNLGNGQLPNTKTTIYTVPIGKSAIVRSVLLVNTSGAAVTLNLYAKFDGVNSRRIMPKDLTLQANALYESDIPVTLEGGDVIEGEASAATTVDYIVSGVESL